MQTCRGSIPAGGVLSPMRYHDYWSTFYDSTRISTNQLSLTSLCLESSSFATLTTRYHLHNAHGPDFASLTVFSTLTTPTRPRSQSPFFKLQITPAVSTMIIFSVHFDNAAFSFPIFGHKHQVRATPTSTISSLSFGHKSQVRATPTSTISFLSFPWQ